MKGSSIVLLLLIICNCKEQGLSCDEQDDEKEFSYIKGSKTGPENWEKINSTWKACGQGKMQSPINLLNRNLTVFPSFGDLKRRYRPEPALIKNRGHDIMVRWPTSGGSIYVNRTEYKLVQCHWHIPSEHTFNGIRYALELHMVHKSKLNGVAVTGVIFRIGPPDPYLAKLMSAIKSSKDTERYIGVIDPSINIDGREYYRYLGSLTTPPCTEGVIWTIMKKVKTVSREQLQVLKQAVHDNFEANARPLQSTNRRQVWMYTPKNISISS